MNASDFNEEKRVLELQKNLHERIVAKARELGLISTHFMPILDGVADIRGYVASSPKVMWVLKEAWGERDEAGKPVGGDHEIWECWNPGEFNIRTWLPMMYTLYGISKGKERVEYREMPKADEAMLQLLRKAAYINLNKMPAEKTSDDMRVRYKLWRDIVLDQIEGYDPDVIIFGGTFDVMKGDLIAPGSEPITKTPTENIAHFYRDGKGRLLINALHPAQHSVSREHYIDEIVDQIRELNK